MMFLPSLKVDGSIVFSSSTRDVMTGLCFVHLQKYFKFFIDVFNLALACSTLSFDELFSFKDSRELGSTSLGGCISTSYFVPLKSLVDWLLEYHKLLLSKGHINGAFRIDNIHFSCLPLLMLL